MNHKRGKCRRNVRCTLCTPHRWQGNSRNRFKGRDLSKRQAADEAIRETQPLR